MTQSALVLLSGGQDSTVCLAWALENHDRVETVGFDYGQRHGVEMQCRTQILQRLGQIHPSWTGRLQDDHLLDLTTFGQISETAMTHDVEISATESGLPNTFVPGRNLLFFTYAAAIAYRRGIHTLVGGMCETDYSGYPDCRDKTIQALAEVITLGMDYDLKIATPLMWLDKAATWAMADQIGGPELVSLIVEDTHTCYLGSREQRHEWGYGCGTCPACQLRAKGWHSWRSS